MVQDSPSRKMDQFIVRLPDGMRDRIKAAAEANNRSMNAEVVASLEKEYPAPIKSTADAKTFFEMMEMIETAPTENERNRLMDEANRELELLKFDKRVAVVPSPWDDGKFIAHFTPIKPPIS